MPTKKQRKYVGKLIKELRTYMYLNRWEIDTYYAKDDLLSGDDSCTLASIVTRFNYFEADITIYPHFFSKSEEEQKKTILHELAHIHVQPFSDIYGNLVNGKLVTPREEHEVNEQLTTMITTIALKEAMKRVKDIKLP